MMPEHAVVAYTELNGTLFHGRMFHVLPGKANDRNIDDEDGGGNFKKKKQQELRKTAGLTHNWNTLFLGSNAVAEVMSKTYGKSKEEVLDSSTGGSNAAVRLALGETQIVLEMKKFLESNGVMLEAFDDVNSKRSKTIILAKNLPAATEIEELQERFAEFGVIEKILLPPSGITCLVKFEQPSEAKKAFRRLAYSKFKHLPLYLEWAPENTFKQESSNKDDEKVGVSKEEEVEERPEAEANAVELVEDNDDDDDSSPEPNTTLFMKNLNFETSEETVRDHFKHLGAIHVIQIAKKRSPENPQHQIPLGYGFIQFKMTSTAEKALRTMQFCVIDDKQIELKRSDRTVQSQAERKPSSKKKEQKTSTKIMVRNIPFQANTNEIRDLFKTFGELKAVRLPKKMASDQHRGFGFIDFLNKSDAKNAFEALHHSTHLYGRRLVLEWAEADQDVDEIRKRTAEQMGPEEMKPKKRKKALLKDEDFIKFASDNEDDNE
jgi:multiple RNA-binding domain-containing protein 1